MSEEEKLYIEMYEQTKEYGRSQFVKEIIRLQKEIERLKTRKKSTKTSKKIHGEYKHVRLTEEELQKLIECYGEELTKQLITYLDEYIEMKGYKAKSHYLCIKKWVVEAVKDKKYKYNRQPVREEKIPEWFNKEIKPELAPPEEVAELQEMLKEFY